MTALLAWILPVSLLLGSGGDTDFGVGVRAYEEGKFKEALEAFSAAEKAAGEEASLELHYNLTLAGLRAGDLRVAEASLGKVSELGGAELAVTCEFLRGNLAFARAEQAVTELDLPGGAPPFVLDLAIRNAEAADKAWRRVLRSRADRPEARRNVERALLMLEDLKKRKEEADKQKKKKKKEKKPPEKPKPDTQEEVRIKAQRRELSPEEVDRLADKLVEKEKEKRDVRRARQQSKRSEVEKDW